jgi:DNA polymerase III sliding clamp (beta) subunit (PCNA family)
MNFTLIKKITITNKKDFLNTLKVFNLNKEKHLPTLQQTYFIIDYYKKLLTIKNTDQDTILTNIFTIKTDLALPSEEFLVETKQLFSALTSCKKMDSLEFTIGETAIGIGAFMIPIKKFQDFDNGAQDAFDIGRVTNFKDNKNLLEFKINGDLLIKNIKHSLNFVSNDETRPYLQGVAIKFKDNGLGFYATTGHVLIKINNFDNLGTIDNSNNNFFILPTELCKKINGSADILNNDVKIIFKKYSVTITSDNFRIDARLIDAEFPEADKVIPREEWIKIKITTDLKNFIETLKMANKIDNDNKHNALEFNLINHNRFLLTKKNKDTIMFQAPLDASCQDATDFKIGLNNKFLLKFIETYKNFTNESNIVLNFQDAYSPLKIECVDGNQAITMTLMPLRL